MNCYTVIVFLSLDLLKSLCQSHETRLATMSFKVLEFHNHERRRMDKTCCGYNATEHTTLCTADCSLEFRLCIEPFAIPVSLTNQKRYSGPCVYGQTVTGHWGNTDTTYGFQEAPTHSIGITLPWPMSYTIILEAYELITLQEKYLIDRAVHRGILRPITSESDPKSNSNSKEWHHVTTSTQFSGYTFSIRLACQPNRYNSTCTKICVKNSTRYTCEINGDKVCELGWSGEECDTAICQIGCHPLHGSCTQPGDCECAIGWQGPYCDECIKYPGCKHGTCDDAPFTCRCLPNWGGPFCDQDLDFCGRNLPCKNGAICKNTNSTMKPFNCNCKRGYTGERCEIKLPACSWNPCKRGQCLPKGKYDFQCKCEPGWEGDYCEENIDYCLQNLCLNGGTCQDLDGVGFRCICPSGFKGSNCQLRSPCGNSRCVHARDCTQLSPPVNGMDYTCVCQPGWTGQFCDQNINDCDGKCQNGGICHDLLDDFYCSCPKGFYGRHCEVNRECANDPCQNNGICHEVPGGYRCECPDGLTGHNCEIAIGSCNPNPCQNAAYCYTLPDGFFCKCPQGYYGKYCEHKRPYCGANGCTEFLDPCYAGIRIAQSISTPNSNRTDSFIAESTSVGLPWGICGPHGTCTRTDSTEVGYRCVCISGFQGKFCQEHVNFCEGNPCMHEGTCVNGVDTFECICEQGFTGPLCQTGKCVEAECCLGWQSRWQVAGGTNNELTPEKRTSEKVIFTDQNVLSVS